MKNETIQIQAPNFGVASFTIEGMTPLVMNKFSKKAREQMMATQAAGSKAKKGSKREAKDFDRCYEEAIHYSKEGWKGIPAASFRAAMISACRLVGFKMTHAKLSIFIIADGIDADEGTPLVKITKGEPRRMDMATRNETGVCDIRPRPLWEEWEAKVTIRYDADIFTITDVSNLLMRAGMQVGVGEGRPDSKKSTGMGWGTFKIKEGRK